MQQRDANPNRGINPSSTDNSPSSRHLTQGVLLCIRLTEVKRYRHHINRAPACPYRVGRFIRCICSFYDRKKKPGIFSRLSNI
jgi:hypothetical protein